MTEQELAIWCARKDKQAQKELYERYSSRILALCRRYSANDTDERIDAVDHIGDKCIDTVSVSDFKHPEQNSDISTDSFADCFSAIPEQVGRIRPKLSFSFRAGAGSERRNDMVTLESSTYIEALTYMNAVDPIYRPSAISSCGDAITWFDEYKSSNEESAKDEADVVGKDATSHYRHDLPITLGLNARIDLTARFGAECGLEYTYMHSRIHIYAFKHRD